MKMSSLTALLVLSLVACNRSTPAANRSQSQTQGQASASESEAQDSSAGKPNRAGLPFEPGKAPTIDEAEVSDWPAFLTANPWCTKAAGGRKLVFNPDGTYSETGFVAQTGTWTHENGRLSLRPSGGDAGVRQLDAQAGKVNGRTVLSLDGVLHAVCN